MRFKKTVIGSVILGALLVAHAPAGAADERPDGTDDVYAALERDLGLTREDAEVVGAQQQRAAKLDVSLQRRLGEAHAGAWFDLRRGVLVVNVTDEKAAEIARSAGADVRLVKHTTRELERIAATFDEAAGAAPAGDRRDQRGVTHDIGFVAWSVDPVTNSVLVTVTPEQSEAATKLLADYGDAVTMEETLAAPEVAADFMDGGDAINSSTCSAGFNLRNPSTGARYLLTAGHCVSDGSTLSGQGGTTFGKVLESWYPSYDDAIVRNDNTSFWIQGPWVDTNPSNGGIITSSGSTDGLVGTVVCKSGITTKWTCGTITAKNQTVTYTGGNTVSGLTRHNACVEKGDSGGANVSVSGSTRRAEGVTSGASLIDWGGKKRCISAVFGWLGFQSTSWYFPIADSLAYYGPRYGVTTW